MTIEKRTEWGSLVARIDVVRRKNDHELVDACSSPTSGDMHLSLGSPDSSNNEQKVWRKLPVDHIAVRLDNGECLIALAHITAGQFMFGEFSIVANTAFVRGRHVFHSSHPNDGIIEFLVVDRQMTLRQRLLAVRRVAHGMHIPHPLVSSSRGKEKIFHFSTPKQIRIDGRRVGRSSSLAVSVLPDAGAVFIASNETIQET